MVAKTLDLGKLWFLRVWVRCGKKIGEKEGRVREEDIVEMEKEEGLWRIREW